MRHVLVEVRRAGWSWLEPARGGVAGRAMESADGHNLICPECCSSNTLWVCLKYAKGTAPW